ncbi:class I SAM-dependent methyltransferase [Salinibacter ruber]|uniref:class I SAM-dependent methyltransferase n=1 Tax=Salinibacter ruber TaxID=146919 RepID=UPI002168DBE3|nr:class I SAM-dependent methyltransferase [Salinibacter ruber]MCS3642383.1 2-polyprenyl-3-methyl-5-hydroxy-6-metoxy-1,4-benzoquinol methylase [Salinibacter ruber]
MRKYLSDTLAPQIDALTWYRFRVLSDFIVRGPVKVLNVGTGGGVETLRLLEAGNKVTSIEYDPEVFRRTRERVKRNGYSDRWDGYEGHVLDVDIEDTFHVVWMTEVLEHIMDDYEVVEQVSEWLDDGGRYVMSTPTASYGQIGTYTPLSNEEDGAHVRVGYDGPELDEMLKSVGLITVRREYIDNWWVRKMHKLEKKIEKHSNKTRYFASLLMRPVLPAIDKIPPYEPFCQITMAIKKPSKLL